MLWVIYSKSVSIFILSIHKSRAETALKEGELAATSVAKLINIKSMVTRRAILMTQSHKSISEPVPQVQVYLPGKSSTGIRKLIQEAITRIVVGMYMLMIKGRAMRVRVMLNPILEKVPQVS